MSKTAQTMLAIGSIFAFSNVCTKYNQCHNSKVYIILDLDLKFHKCHHILLWAISFKIYSHESFRLHLHYTVNSKTKLKPASFHSFSKTYIKSQWLLHSMLLARQHFKLKGRSKINPRAESISIPVLISDKSVRYLPIDNS